MYKTETKIKQEFDGQIAEFIRIAEPTTQNCVIEIFDTHKGFKVHTTENVINVVFGNALKTRNEVLAIETYVDDEGKEQPIESANVNKGFVKCITPRYETQKPDASNAIGRAWNSLKKDFYRNFIEADRWKTIVAGLGNTLKLTFFSLIIGIILGFLVAFVRCTYLKQSKKGVFLKISNAICQVYLSVIRGTPAIVQITIIYFVIFMPLGVDKFVAAVVCFGINSGAYVAEIVRGGIMSVDEGQTEAGRSLGFGYMSTMYHIVFPQAFKAVLPALANEFVVLLKETSIAFYIGIGDIMYSVNAIRAATYTPFMPLIAAAIIYFILVVILSKLVSLLERRLRKSER
ncbi:MAG: amino acid ABC transporter permease [Clostridia bacterium]|nr:amino acid ABC transporter permease [Clostridia bacterium]